MNKAAYFALLLLGACAGQTPRAETIRKESGALGEETFLEAPWRSSNIDQTGFEKEAPGMVVLARDQGQSDVEFTEYLETELAALARFPVIPMVSGASVDAGATELESLGMIGREGGQGDAVEVKYLLELNPRRRSEVRDAGNYSPLRQVPFTLYEYWYEGPANLFVLEGGRRRAIWGDRTFRSRSAWKWSRPNRTGGVGFGFDPTDSNSVDLAYKEARSSLLFNFAKEVYSKLGRVAPVENALRTGSNVVVSTPLGKNEGVLQGQPMFIIYREGNLEVFLAKAMADNVTASGSTLRVIQWKRGDAMAQEMAKDPSGFVSRQSGNLVTRTEGLTLPEEWSERTAELDRLLQKYVDDATPVEFIPSRKDQKAVLELISGQ